jgi:D-amino-acid oxidase
VSSQIFRDGAAPVPPFTGAANEQREFCSPVFSVHLLANIFGVGVHSSHMQNRAAIIGAGVSGLTCGVVFAERGWSVTIFADETGQQTTSAAAAAVWFPYDAEPAEKIIPWALTTYKRLRDLSRDPQTGVSMIEIRQFARVGQIPIPNWAKNLGAHPFSVIPSVAEGSLTIPAFSASPARTFASGYALTVPLTDTTIYLDYLTDRFRKAGGMIQSTHINKVEEIPPDFDLIINCAGIGARELVHDPDLEPHRGLVAIVSKLDLTQAIVCDDAPLMYAIPRANDCVFGGTNSLSDSREPSVAETEAIVSECSQVLGVDRPRVTAVKVGLRPFRKSGVRLESEKLSDGRTIIHNYGHGGAGFTLSWACAEEVYSIARRAN